MEERKSITKETAPSQSGLEQRVIRIYQDNMKNLYVKTEEDHGFMVRLSDGTKHDGTTIGSFTLIKEMEV